MFELPSFLTNIVSVSSVIKTVFLLFQLLLIIVSFIILNQVLVMNRIIHQDLASSTIFATAALIFILSISLFILTLVIL